MATKGNRKTTQTGSHYTSNGTFVYVNMAGSTVQVPPQQQPQQNPLQQQQTTQAGAPVTQGGVTQISSLDDDGLAALYISGMQADLPDQLNDLQAYESKSLNDTQRFVYAAGMNAKPQVMDDATFDAYVKQNHLKSQVLARSVNPITYTANGTTYKFTSDEISDQFKKGAFNYVGGKHGGNVHGNGTYFDMNGGKNTGYGGNTMVAVLGPNAKTIDSYALRNKARTFAASHPKFARAVGNVNSSNVSCYALAMGYNVITSGSYTNVIDRSAVIVRKSNV